ncbi:50S ribosomal protein L29 [Candidatus Saccharibacteria bacterium]|jgi:ribosomal protein L29|uniref:Large ribosomal subunit protein uL29 n=1 Tax=Candidatus Southlakia epibionticum TaxID=3043284 RepID=A0ABY8WW58_9BACT|nr:50S ribosomal protein L29 [Candidatus Saccharibacteria bacterium]QUB37107.1 50S ribosomal protein L29 [TM7 phylum sp. oral taxon 349]RKV94964.1 MAG: 50S ribosomal protein L29 [Candidatus Saccharimonas sp.]WIO46087.1 50S ribosomal protein L29 [Candidatus Saccharimonadaceae bacterium ML1]
MADTKKTAKKADVVKTIDELRAELATKQQDLNDSRRSHKAGELVNPRVLGQIRKEIARLHTAIHAAELKEEQ